LSHNAILGKHVLQIFLIFFFHLLVLLFLLKPLRQIIIHFRACHLSELVLQLLLIFVALREAKRDSHNLVLVAEYGDVQVLLFEFTHSDLSICDRLRVSVLVVEAFLWTRLCVEGTGVDGEVRSESPIQLANLGASRPELLICCTRELIVGE